MTTRIEHVALIIATNIVPAAAYSDTETVATELSAAIELAATWQ